MGSATAGATDTSVSGTAGPSGFAGGTGGTAGRCGPTGPAGAATGSRHSAPTAHAADAATGCHGQTVAMHGSWLAIDTVGVGHRRSAAAEATGACFAHRHRQLDGCVARWQRLGLALDRAARAAASAASAAGPPRCRRYPGAPWAGSSTTPTTSPHQQHIHRSRSRR